MTRRVWLSSLVALTLVAAAVAKDHTGAPAKKCRPRPAQETRRNLVEVDAKGQPTNTVVSVFKVTSNGSALQETIFPGSDHEMVTVYHVDGPDLVLTHYCALGNQPHLKLDPKGLPHQLSFKFVSGPNMDAAKDMHMHEGQIRIVDDDHITWQWAAYQGGKPLEGQQITKTLVRKK